METQFQEALLAGLGQLRSIIEGQLAEIHGKVQEALDRIEHAVEVMREQTEEIGVLRDSIDESRELYEWAWRNRQGEAPPVQLTSLPLDPAATDFAERVNRVVHQDLPEFEFAGETGSMVEATALRPREHATRDQPPEQGHLWPKEGQLF